jgi:choline dehydrogenase-like flavoprotein
MFRGLPTHAHLWFPLVRPGYLDGYGIRPTLLHPRSRGAVTLASADPNAPMRIQYNFFSDPEDLPALRHGFKVAREVGYAPPLAPYRGEEKTPGDKVRSDDEIDAYIRRTAVTAHHPAGTCKMGEDDTAVVDSQMKVRGVENLRVVDASAMPDMVGAHINACVSMMAEKAADMILGRPPAPANADA